MIYVDSTATEVDVQTRSSHTSQRFITPSPETALFLEFMSITAEKSLHKTFIVERFDKAVVIKLFRVGGARAFPAR